jgi:hypothetical protein
MLNALFGVAYGLETPFFPHLAAPNVAPKTEVYRACTEPSLSSIRKAEFGQAVTASPSTAPTSLGPSGPIGGFRLAMVSRFWPSSKPVSGEITIRQRQPVTAEAGQTDPQQAVARGQFRAFSCGPPKHADLVAQSQVLELDGGTRTEDREQSCEECRERNEHQRRIMRDGIILIGSDSSRFSRGTEQQIAKPRDPPKTFMLSGQLGALGLDVDRVERLARRHE